MCERAATSDRDFWADADESEALRRYRTLVDIVDDGIYQLDADGRFVAVNDRVLDLTDYAREDLLGEHISLVLAEDDHRRIEREISTRLSTGDRRQPLELAAETADGELIPCELRLSLLTDDGEFRGTVGIVRDISERKRAEAIIDRRELEEELELFRTLLDHSTDSVLVIDPETGRYLDVNETACRRRGYSRAEFLELSVFDVETELSDRERWQSFVADLRAAGTMTFDGRHRRKDGTTYPVEVNMSYVELDREYVLAVSRDVTERRQRERELERKERILETIDDGVYVLDGDSRFDTVNEAFADMLGRDRESLIGEHAATVFPDAKVDRAERLQRELLEGEIDIAELEEHVTAAEGQIPVVTRFDTFETGDEVGRVGVVRDVTDRKQRERRLERNKEQLEALFEVLPVGVVVAEADGAIVAANDTAHEIWGGDVFDVDSVEEYERYSVRWADSGERVDPEEMTLARVLRGEEVRDPNVFEIDTADGERRIIEAEGMPIRNEGGEVSRGVITLSDVTERRDAQRRLAESERRYRTIVENFPNGAVGLFDEDLRYTAAGGAVLAEVGTSEDEIVGKTLWERYPDELAAQFEPNFRAALDGDTNAFEIEFHGRHWIAYTLPVADDDGDAFAGMVMVQDITERREYQRKLEESNERLEQFAYAVSHDLQEPLRMVTSYLQLLEDRYGDAFDADGEEFLEFAVDGAERMREMIDALLEYSRIETRGDPLEPVDLDEVVDDVRTDLHLRIEETDAEIESEPLPVVEGDANQLRQVFQNLLSNAIEYSGDERPRVQIRAERDGENWKISVSDEGIGIDPDDQERIFEVFQRLHTREEHEGTGIGLALCERIVERHGVRASEAGSSSAGSRSESAGGDIWVDSEPGEGATFSFTLPAASGQET